MRLLLDTQILIWAVATPAKLSKAARILLEDPDNELSFSVISIWETTIKYALGRQSFPYEPRKFRSGLLQSGFREVEVSAEHTLAVGQLPRIHRDPFDRLLLAQATVENMVLVTSDPMIAKYPGTIRLV